MAAAFVVLGVALCAVGLQAVALSDLSSLKQQLAQQEVTCDPPCGENECCTHYMAPIHGGRALGVGGLLGPALTPWIIRRCQPLKQRAERCLVHSNAEWCNCANSMTCVADGASGLDAFFGKCH